MRALAIIAFLLVIVPLLILIAGQFGFLTGQRPSLGVNEGRLQPPSRTPNSVSSQALLWRDGEYASAYARIEPLPLRGDPQTAIARLRKLLESWPGATIIEERPDYLRVEFMTRWLHFVDDTEFWLDPADNVIQVRSASRLGRKDFGVNRERIEAIRSQWTNAAMR